MLTSNGATPALRPSPQQSLTAPAPAARPDPEVVARPAQARRRQFTVAYKLRILDEAAHTAIGQLGALLRREGLYSSHLSNWRRQRVEGTLTALAPQRRGRPATPAAEREVAQLRVENARLTRKLAAAELVIEVQKKVAALLGAVGPDAAYSVGETPSPPESAARRGRSA
jgi:transposase-like protein